MTNDEKLLDKVQKLLAMGKSENAHEAAAFLEKATALMEAHGLTHKDIGRAQIGTKQVKSTQSISKVKDWENSLVWMVAKAFGCTVMWQSGDSRYLDYWGRFLLIGPKDKVELAEYATVVLLRQLVTERAKFSRLLSERGYYRGKAMTAQLDGFCKGWIATVRAKVHVFSNAPELQATIDEYIKEMSTGMIKSQSRGNGSLGNRKPASPSSWTRSPA